MKTSYVRKLRNDLDACKTLEARAEWLASYSEKSVGQFNQHWWSWARTEQMAPESDWLIWLFLGGRGAGKTRAGAEWVRARVHGRWPDDEPPARRIALVGPTLHDVRSVMVEGVSGLLGVHRDGERPVFEPSLRRLVWPNGAVAQMFSAEEPDSLRGPQFDAAWADGASNFARSSVLRYVNQKRFTEVPARLSLWCKAGGRVLRGLIRRRAAEGALFLSPPSAVDGRAQADEVRDAGRQVVQRRGKSALRSSTNRAAAGLTVAVLIDQLKEVLSLAERAGQTAREVSGLAPAHFDWGALAWPVALSLLALAGGAWIIRERMKKSTEFGV